jgi:hypothetical protein
VPCEPTNASTFSASSSTKLGTLGVANFASLCSYASIGVFSTQGLRVLFLGNQPIRKRKMQRFKRVFKEKWATQFPWVEHVVDSPSKTHMVHCKVCSLVEGKDKIINLKLETCKKNENINFLSRSFG